jgi:hypothetical protein
MSEALPNNSPIEPAAIQAARKELTVAVRDVVARAQDLEQLALLDEVPFEEAMVLPVEEVRKRYTAENSRQIEWRREACVKLLARQCPAIDIADILKMNPRTIAAVAAQEGQKIAAFSHALADTLAGSAMSDLALADTKKHGASYKDLHIGAGIKLTHAVAMKMVGATGEDPGVIELEAENPALQSARRFLELRKVTPAATDETQKSKHQTPIEVENTKIQTPT